MGDDQRQHLELARELAVRFNNRYGETFTVPEAAIPGTAARVMDLQHPERKMSKSVESPLGTIGLLDSDEEITSARCAGRSPTPTARCATTAWPSRAWPTCSTCWPPRPGRTPVEVAAGYDRYGDLKNDVAAALSDLIGPVRRRRAELEADLPYVHGVLAARRGARTRGRGGDVREGRGRRGAAARRVS